MKKHSEEHPSTDKSINKRGKKAPAQLAPKLLHIRRYHKLSQSEMFMIIKPDEENPHINRSIISQFERGVRTPSLIEVLNYAKFAGINVEVLINDELELPF